MTIEALEAYGADVKAGVARCMGMQDFYLRMVGMELNDGNFDRLDRALAGRNVWEAFDAAQALKGAVGNLALTPLYAPSAKSRNGCGAQANRWSWAAWWISTGKR